MVFGSTDKLGGEIIITVAKRIYRNIKLKRKFPSCEINSSLIHKTAKLGENIFVGSNVIVGKNCSIGSNTYLNQNTMFFSGEIGSYCSISYNCVIGAANHPINLLSTSPKIYGVNNSFKNKEWKNDYESPPLIGSDVWIGANAIIMQGVTIGDGAIIGAGAIVTKDVPSYAIVVGIPAKIIKYRFSKEIIKELNRIKWWNLSESEIKKVYNAFIDNENEVLIKELIRVK